jgi:hypothetical protein
VQANIRRTYFEYFQAGEILLGKIGLMDPVGYYLHTCILPEEDIEVHAISK